MKASAPEATAKPTNSDEFVREYEDVIKRAARNEHKGSTVFDRSDLEQEAWLAILPHWPRMAAEGEGFIYKSAATAMQRYAANERVDFEYFSGKFVYTPDVVRTQLELGLDREDACGDWDIRLDVREAWKSLPLRENDLIYRVYFQGETVDWWSTERRMLNRAVDKMTEILNKGVAYQRVELLAA